MTKKRNYREKVCEWCGETYKPNSNSQKVCANCTKLKKQAYDREYSIANKEKILARKKIYYQKNIDKKREYTKINKEKRNEYNKKWYQKK